MEVSGLWVPKPDLWNRGRDRSYPTFCIIVGTPADHQPCSRTCPERARDRPMATKNHATLAVETKRNPSINMGFTEGF